jgi:hypothetical protein
LAASAFSAFRVHHQNAVEGDFSINYFRFVMSLDVWLRFIRWIEGDESFEDGQSQHLPHNDKAKISHGCRITLVLSQTGHEGESVAPRVISANFIPSYSAVRKRFTFAITLELSSRLPKSHQ